MISDRCRKRMAGVQPDLVRVIERAAKDPDASFIVTEGLRTVERQKELVAAGRSKTMNSRHITGHAVDLAVIKDGKAVWDANSYRALAVIVKRAAKEEGVRIEWGGDWKGFFDGPHFQLPVA